MLLLELLLLLLLDVAAVLPTPDVIAAAEDSNVDELDIFTLTHNGAYFRKSSYYKYTAPIYQIKFSKKGKDNFKILAFRSLEAVELIPFAWKCNDI